MSETPHVQRCIEWIREQVEALATLRTANTRDQSFRNWRQNTVTVIQRIWPEDHERVERFRRIAFSPPHSRADVRLTREWFGKGIGESRAYLNVLLETIEREGVPAPAEADRERDDASLEADVAFPMLDLSAKAAGETAAGPASPAAAPAGGLDVTSGYATADDQGGSRRDPSSPAPPALRVDWKAAAAEGAPRAESPAPAGPPPLGESRASDAPDDGDRPPVEIPLAPALAPGKDTGAEPESETPPVAAEVRDEAAPPAPAEDASPAPAPPVRETPPPRRESPSRAMSRLRQGKGKGKKSGPKPKLKDLLGLSDFESRMEASGADAAEEPAAGTPAAVPPAETPALESDAPVAEAASPAEREPREDEAVAAAPASDDADRERATLDFMRSSPVFGLVGKPVQRRTDAPEHTEPDAVAVAALAGELARLGVPDGMKGSLAARLHDVAARLEAGDLDWPLLRGTVTDAMQYPLLARRLMPVLLPWLERAA